MTSRDVVIRTAGLTKRFGQLTAVDRLDLEVYSGEIFGLLGPNGAGKTTTVGMLTTRVTPTLGRAEVGGVDVINRPAVAKQTIGVVPQSNTLDRSLSVLENLYFHGRYFGMGKKDSQAAASKVLEQFRLSERADAPVAALSGGMAQRLMVARAIMHRPKILFLDEPTAGLDPQSRIAMWEILGELHAAGQTILLTTHYMQEADELCDRVAIMDHGQILALDTPSGLKANSGASTTATVSAAGDLSVLAKTFEEMASVKTACVSDGTVKVVLASASGVAPALIAEAQKAGYDVTDLSVSEPTLETVFISLTGKDLRE